MFRLFTRNILAYAAKAKPQINTFAKQSKANPRLLATGIASIPLAYYLKSYVFCTQPHQ